MQTTTTTGRRGWYEPEDAFEARTARERGMSTTTSDRRQGSYYSIAENVLDAVAEQAEVERETAARVLVDYDWRDGTHQEWLDTASVTEIVAWLTSMMNDLDDEDLS